MSAWTIVRCEGVDQLDSIFAFLLDLFCEVFGESTMQSEVCQIYNDPHAACPMLVTNNTPIRIRLSQPNLAYWTQTIFQLSHELCHYALRQHKEDKSVILHWFEEIVCEAMSLYCLKYSAENWSGCSLSLENPLYGDSINDYLHNEISNVATNEFKHCNTNRSLSLYETNRVSELRREGHINERNSLYRAITREPQSIREICQYPSYINNDGITIDFNSWLHNSNIELVRVLQDIQPVKESPLR